MSRGNESCKTLLPLELGEDGWKAWVMSIHQNLSIQPVPIRLNDASFDALAETVECSLVELMEKSVLCAVHRLHGASHDGASFDDDVPNPFLPTVGAADVNLAYAMRHESAHGAHCIKELHHVSRTSLRTLHAIGATESSCSRPKRKRIV